MWFIHFLQWIEFSYRNFMSWETNIWALTEFYCKIECHKPFSTLNYECSHAVTNNTSIISAQTKYYYQIFPVVVRWFLDAGGNLSKMIGLFIHTRRRRRRWVVVVILQNLHATLLTHHPSDKYMLFILIQRFIMCRMYTL